MVRFAPSQWIWKLPSRWPRGSVAAVPPNQQSLGPLQAAASIAKNGSLEPIGVLYEPTTAPFLK